MYILPCTDAVVNGKIHNTASGRKEEDDEEVALARVASALTTSKATAVLPATEE